MSPDEFATLEEFRGLPSYDKGDPQAQALRRMEGGDPSYAGEIAEVDILPKAREYLHSPEWEPRGAIRASAAGDEAIFAVFWRKRIARPSEVPEDTLRPRLDLPEPGRDFPGSA